MHKVLDEDTIEVLPHLSKAKRRFEMKANKAEVINAILFI